MIAYAAPVVAPADLHELQAALRDAAQDIQALRDEIGTLKRKIEDLDKRQDEDNDLRAVEIAQDRQRISALEAKRGALTQSAKTEDKLRRLDALLLGSGDMVAFATIGKVLELGSRDPKTGRSTRKQNMTLFSRAIASHPERYIIYRARRGTQKFVSLTPEYRSRLKRSEG